MDLATCSPRSRRGFGAVVVLPIHGKAGGPAIRVLVRAVKDRNGPLTLLSGLVLTDADGKPTVAAETVLRDGKGLSLTQN